MFGGNLVTPAGRAAVALNGRLSAARRIGVTLAEYVKRRESGQRWCWCCRVWLPENAFYASRQSGCRDCHHARVVAAMAARRAGR